jgi:hypothetical protein
LFVILHFGLIRLNPVARQITVNATVFHVNNSLGVMGHELLVRDYDNGLAFPVKPIEQIHDAFACFAVEISRRLVRQQNARSADECSCDSDALLFTS